MSVAGQAHANGCMHICRCGSCWPALVAFTVARQQVLGKGFQVVVPQARGVFHRSTFSLVLNSVQNQVPQLDSTAEMDDPDRLQMAAQGSSSTRVASASSARRVAMISSLERAPAS